MKKMMCRVKMLMCLLLMMSSFFAGNLFAAGKTIMLTVNGMVCSFCAQGIEKKLTAEPAVESLKVSLKDKTVTLTLRDGKDLSDEKIKTLLKEAGYTVDSIQIL